MHAKDAAAKAFDGYWTYNNDCHFGHYAEIKLAQKGADVAGDWSDGTRVEGWDGLLKGSVRDGKLHAKYCSSEANSDHTVRPSYDASESTQRGITKFSRIAGDDKPFDPRPFMDFDDALLWGCNNLRGPGDSDTT